MTNYIRVILLITVIFFQQSEILIGQDKSLHVGDKCPDFIFSELVNYHSSSARLSEFKGKAVILDFWFTQCAPCKEAMPKLDSLQKVYADDLQIIMVTYQDRKTIESFFKTSTPHKHIGLPNVVSDSLLRKEYFPHSGEPYQVWIDKDGFVKGFSGAEQTNSANIEKLINGYELDFDAPSFEPNPKIRFGEQPLMVSTYPDNMDDMLYYSFFGKGKKELAGTLNRPLPNKKSKTIRLVMQNVSFEMLYKEAYRFLVLRDNHPINIIRKDKSSKSYIADWQSFVNTYCYEIMMGDTSTMKLYKYMQVDLDRFFKVSSKIDTINVNCLVLLTTKDNNTRFREISNKRRERYFTDDSLIVKSIPVSAIVDFFNRENYFGYPVINETGYVHDTFTFSIPRNIDDLTHIQKTLNSYGLDLSVEKRTLKVITIEDTN